MQPSWHNKPHYWIPRRRRADVVMAGHFTWENGAWCTVSGFGQSNRITYALFYSLIRESIYFKSGDSSVVRAPASWSKCGWFESLQERRENCLLQGLLSFSRVAFPSPGSPFLLQGLLSFSRVAFLRWLIPVSVPPRVTAVACKRSLRSAQATDGRLQLNSHAPYAWGFEWSDMTWRMVVWCTQNALKRQQFHVASPT